MRHRISLRLLIGALASMAGSITNAQVTPGDLDTSFGTAGIVKSSFGADDDGFTSLLLLPDGKLIAGGSGMGSGDLPSVPHFALARYLPTGEVDTTFISGLTEVSADGSSIQALARQADGRIIAVGSAEMGTSQDVAVVRYLGTGAIDGSFGVGGKVTVDFSARQDIAYGVAIHPATGKIVIVGHTVGATAGDEEVIVIRLNSNGSPDTTFGSAGRQRFHFGPSYELAKDVEVLADGKILFAGDTITPGFGGAFLMARLTPTGALDTTFATGGVVRTNFEGTGDDLANSIRLLSDGRILLAGYADNDFDRDFAMSRYLANGQLDTTFGDGGKVQTPISATAGQINNDEAFDIVVQPGDGKLIVVGNGLNVNRNNMQVLRYFSNGTLDPSFGVDGIKVMALGTSGDDEVNNVVLQGDGKVVVCARAEFSTGTHGVLVRLETGLPPTLTTLAATNVTSTGVALNGLINANGGGVTGTFQWGLSPAAMTRIAVVTPDLVTGTTAIPVSSTLEFLTPNTLYYYRLTAGSFTGATLSFRTATSTLPPLVTTQQASNITFNSATIFGVSNPRGNTAETSFEYGTTTSYGFSTQGNPAQVTGNLSQTIQASLTGLRPHTLYHYRARSASSTGLGLGLNRSFITANRLPVANTDTVQVLPQAKIVIPVLANDTDPDGDILSIHSYSTLPPSIGTLVKTGTTSFTFTAAAGFTGGSFSYTASDGFGGLALSIVTLTRPACIVTPPTQSIASAGGSYQLQVNTTGAWAVVEALPFVSVSPTSGIGNGTVTVSVLSHASLANRGGSITVGGEVHQLTQTGLQTPVLSTPTSIPNGVVSGTFSLGIPTQNGPVSYTVTGLPSGLSINSAGIISGKPNAAGNSTVRIFCRNLAGISNTISFPLLIAPMHANAIGAFSAVIHRQPTLTVLGANYGGSASFQVSSVGSVTGSLRLGLSTYNLTSRLEAVDTTGGVSPFVIGRLTSTIIRSGLPALRLLLDFYDTGAVAGTLESDTEVVPVAAGRHGFNASNLAVPAARKFTIALPPSGVEGTPEGNGFITGTLSTLGTLSYTLNLADGVVLTSSTTLWSGPKDAPLFQMLYANRGSIVGMLDFNSALDEVSGALDWLKLPHATRSYSAGFGPLDLTVTGKAYAPPNVGATLLGLSDLRPDKNATIALSGGNIELATQAPFLVQDFFILPAPGNSFIFDTGTANPTNLRITSVDLVNGVIFGAATLVDPDVLVPLRYVSRTVSFRAAMLGDKAYGYTLLPELPDQAGETLLNTPLTSVGVLVEALSNAP